MTKERPSRVRIGNGWANVVAAPHACETPSAAWIASQGAGVGTYWQCDCGRHWKWEGSAYGWITVRRHSDSP